MYRLIILLLIPVNGWADCSHEKSKNIAFSSENKTDVITSRVVAGEACSKGFEHIMIKKSNGWWLYEYYAPLSHYFRNQPVTKQDVIRIVENNLSEKKFSLTSQLPKWDTEEKYYEKNYQGIKVTKEKYEHYLTQKWPTYTHQVGYEGSKTIVFDRNAKLVREVTSGGP